MGDSGDPWVNSGHPLKIIMSELHLFKPRLKIIMSELRLFKPRLNARWKKTQQVETEHFSEVNVARCS